MSRNGLNVVECSQQLRELEVYVARELYEIRTPDIRPVTIGTNSGVGKPDFPNFMVTIGEKKSDFPTFLEISSRICHFRIDQKVMNSERIVRCTGNLE